MDMGYLDDGRPTNVGSRAAVAAVGLFGAIASLIALDIAADYQS